MKTTNVSRMTKLFSTILGMAAILASILVSCDTLESDLQKPAAEIKEKEVHLPSASSTIIDLNSKIAANQKVKLVVTRQTRKGTLTDLGKGLLQYSPNKNTRRDSFGFTVFSEKNEVVKQDSVVIILEPDSTNLPCGIYLQDDYAQVNRDSVGSGYSIEINPLANDIICGYDSTELELSILHTDSVVIDPSHGTAQVVNGKIKYTPNSSFQTNDRIYYVVKVRSNPSIVSYGVIYIIGFTPVTCTFALVDDYYSLLEDSTGFVTTFLPVFLNDALCDTAFNAYTYNLVSRTGGVATIDYNGIVYTPDTIPANQIHYDTLTYRVCYGNDCKRAKVIVKNKN